MDQLSGFIDSIVFSSDETGFTVARLKQPRIQEVTTIVGTLPGVHPGETIHCQGAWKHHPQHGRQFMVESFDLTAPVDLFGLQKYLESGLIKGIGPIFAKKIISTFGIKTLEVIDQNPERLVEIDGIGEKKLARIKLCWEEQKEVRKVMIFLRSYHMRPSFAQKIFKAYGDKSVEKILENPYLLAKEIRGIGFKTADELAQKLNLPLTSPLRIQSGIEHVLWELSAEGHVCYPLDQLCLMAEKILEVENSLVQKEVKELESEKRLIRAKMPFEGEPKEFIWIRPLYFSESGIAKELSRLLKSPCSLRKVDTEKAVLWAEENLRIHFAPQQKVAIQESLKQKLMIITGGPGTGKSTITRTILEISLKLDSHILLAAPTGRAAKRMSEITRRKAFTIHSLLEIDFNAGGFKRNAQNPLKCSLIIIDEASMIDTQLMAHLLKAIPSEARVIFIGDVDQLPSVGPGNVLQDLIESNTLPTTRLKEIFRQKRGSRIISNAHRVNGGYFPDINPEENSDFIFIEEPSPELIVSKVVHLIKEKLPAAYPFHPIEEIQVLSPMKKGIVGCDHLNHILQQELNPQKLSLNRMGRNFHLQDKVMQIRNNYDKKVFNGDVGKITAIDLENQELIVSFDGNPVSYDFSELDELVLAYAVSIHKYQGSECPCIIIPIHTSHFKLLFRNLLYTGITRGKKLVILIGTKKALMIAVKTNNIKKRFTGLKEMLKSELLVHNPAP